MDTKAAFEAFREWWFAPEQKEIRLNVAEGWGFKLWLASREAIEIELPNKITGTLLHGRVIANDMLQDCTTAITSHGIRIKGKTE